MTRSWLGHGWVLSSTLKPLDVEIIQSEVTAPIASQILPSNSDGIKVLQACWHPFSNNHFAVLTSDAVFRLFDLSSDSEQPEQEFYLQPLPPGKCQNASAICPVAFSYGSDHLWDRFSEAAAEHLEERQADWAYSSPVVALDLLWNFAFITVAAVVLVLSHDEDSHMPLRTWVAGYALQCDGDTATNICRRMPAMGTARRRLQHQRPPSHSSSPSSEPAPPSVLTIVPP